MDGGIEANLIVIVTKCSSVQQSANPFIPAFVRESQFNVSMGVVLVEQSSGCCFGGEVLFDKNCFINRQTFCTGSVGEESMW